LSAPIAHQGTPRTRCGCPAHLRIRAAEQRNPEHVRTIVPRVIYQFHRREAA
jgi:hypothetical protein